MRSLVVVALATSAVGCGLDMAGLAAGEGLDAAAGGDAHLVSEGGAPSGTDAGDARSDAHSTGDSSDAGSCVSSLPAGWALALYESGRVACPPGYGSAHDEVQGATPGAGACGCSCTMTSPPTCAFGTLSTQWSSQPPFPGPLPCANGGTAVPVNGAGCTQLSQAGRLAAGFSAEPLQSSGGSCTATVNPDPTKVAKNVVRTCNVPSPKADGVCSGSAPAGFSACIEAAGDVTCPAGPFSTRFAVSDDVELVCPGCASCTVTGTCGNAQITFFSDTGCNTMVAPAFACNGACQGTGAGNDAGIVAFEYTAQPQPSCLAPTAGSATVTPVGPHTVCCR
jgi:hypothetical protein